MKIIKKVKVATVPHQRQACAGLAAAGARFIAHLSSPTNS